MEREEEEEDRPYTVSSSELDTGASQDSLSDDLNTGMYFGEKASQCFLLLTPHHITFIPEQHLEKTIREC